MSGMDLAFSVARRGEFAGGVPVTPAAVLIEQLVGLTQPDFRLFLQTRRRARPVDWFVCRGRDTLSAGGDARGCL